MNQSTPLLLLLSILPAGTKSRSERFALPDFASVWDTLFAEFADQAITPEWAFELERRLEVALRDYGRQIVAALYNAMAARVDANAERLRYEGEDYRRLAEPTANRRVATLFGVITLHRHAYRCSRRDAGEPCLFAAEMALGLSHGTTPAFAEAATRLLAEAGATQAAVLARLKDRHGVAMGAQRLRDLAATRAAAMAETQTARLADRVLDLLKQADASRGRHKPVLSTGRDGVTMRDYRYRFFECAGVGTLSVSDRRGKRLGTVYLGCVPEPKQTTLSRRLTAVITEVLRRWEGSLPRLCYVTDAGDNETKYFRDVLRRMKHPRTGATLRWQRVVDFYHAMERVWTMAEVLFGANTREGTAWAHRMGKLLKKPSGPSRVLHSAGAIRAKRTLSKTKQSEFTRAGNYIRQRTKWMQYHEYARHKLPLGSGVTEAACKTLVSQRLKLSGMRWTKAGAQVILDLRATLLSGTWDAANQAILATMPPLKWRTQASCDGQPFKLAA
jgi:hypothetical protein